MGVDLVSAATRFVQRAVQKWTAAGDLVRGPGGGTAGAVRGPGPGRWSPLGGPPTAANRGFRWRFANARADRVRDLICKPVYPDFSLTTRGMRAKSRSRAKHEVCGPGWRWFGLFGICSSRGASEER
jgi:hypothetical protein